MAIIFSLYAQCRDAGEAANLAPHFDGQHWTLADGFEITLTAGPHPTPAACWVTSNELSRFGIRDDTDAIRMTELGERLCAHLRTAPPFESALVGVECDHERDHGELVEMIQDGRTGLVVSDELHRLAGSPIAFEEFREGMYWRPYTGETARWPRHVPDLEVVRCLGCDESIRTHELVRHHQHGESPCCIWHPYHLWCIRDALPPAHDIMACGSCGEPFDLEPLRATMRWTAASIHHLHLRTIGVAAPFAVSERADTYAGRPPGVSKIAVVTAGEPNTLSPHERQELVHDACRTDDPWRLRLRAAPGDDELRRVYADHLEQTGDLARAELVRMLVEVPTDEANARTTAERLHRLVANIPRDWLRDVARRG